MNDPEAKDEQDYRWLLARERGDDISHVLAADRKPYEGLGALLGRRVAPSAGWRQRVLDAIDTAEREQPLPPVKRFEPEAPARVGAEVAPQLVAEAAPEAQPVPATQPVPAEAKPVIAAEPVAAPVEARPAPSIERAPAPVVPIERRRARRLWIGGGIAAAAASLAVLMFGIPGKRGPIGPTQVALETTVKRGPEVVRGEHDGADPANVGDTLIVSAEATGPAEIRVYGGSGGNLIAQCNDHGGCKVSRDGERRRFSLEVRLTAPGQARAVIFIGASLPPSSGSIEQDLETAAREGIRHETRAPTRVH